ncbi:MAG: aminotransferase class IV [Phycisphaerales bacterium]
MLVHLNGQLVPHELATVSVFDRGFLFGDGLYEGIRAFGGKVRALDRHIARLGRGLAEIKLDWDAAALSKLVPELIHANKLDDAFIYVQVTRGAPAPGRPWRSRVPEGPVTPTVFAFCTPAARLEQCVEPASKHAMTIEDYRWHRGHIKSISLVSNVMAAITAVDHHEDDAIFVRNGLVGEGTSTNVVAEVGGRLVTPSLESISILGGVTRTLVLDGGQSIESRPVTVAELHAASEVMLIGTLTMVASVVRLDGRPVGEGTVGPKAKLLAAELVRRCQEEGSR